VPCFGVVDSGVDFRRPDQNFNFQIRNVPPSGHHHRLHPEDRRVVKCFGGNVDTMLDAVRIAIRYRARA